MNIWEVGGKMNKSLVHKIGEEEVAWTGALRQLAPVRGGPVMSRGRSPPAKTDGAKGTKNCAARELRKAKIPWQ